MQHSPHVDAIGLLDVEDQVREPVQRPGPQPRNVKLVRVTGRPGPGVPAEEGVGILKGLDEAEGRPARLAPSGSRRSHHRHPGSPAPAGRLAYRSPGGGLADAAAKVLEVGSVSRARRGRPRTIHHERPQALPVAVAADQLAHVLAARAVAPRGDLPLDKLLERILGRSMFGAWPRWPGGAGGFALGLGPATRSR